MDSKTADSEPPGNRGRSVLAGPSRCRLAPEALDLVDATGRLSRVQIDGLQQRAHAAVAAALGDRSRDPDHSVRVRIVADVEMADRHWRYSKVAGTTDVLTFDLAQGASAARAPLDVDIFICIDEALRQAHSRGHGVELELLLYLLHGVLHCLGEDDHDETAYAAMHEREDAILTAIGLPRVFARPAPGDGERA